MSPSYSAVCCRRRCHPRPLPLPSPSIVLAVCCCRCCHMLPPLPPYVAAAASVTVDPTYVSFHFHVVARLHLYSLTLHLHFSSHSLMCLSNFIGHFISDVKQTCHCFLMKYFMVLILILRHRFFSYRYV